jgi:hypothetical protein
MHPITGPICKIKQERNFIESSKPVLTTQSLSKLNRVERLSPTDQKENCDTKQADKGKDSHEISTHRIDNTANTIKIDRHITESKESFNSIAATIALIVTTVGIYELSVMNISMSEMASLPETKQELPEMDIQLGHACFNLTDSRTLIALVVVTILTAVSLDLRRYVKITCQDWWTKHLRLMAREDSTETRASQRHVSQPSDKEKDEDESGTDKDQRSTSLIRTELDADSPRQPRHHRLPNQGSRTGLDTDPSRKMHPISKDPSICPVLETSPGTNVLINPCTCLVGLI